MILSSVDSSLLQDNVAFVLCLDTVGSGDALHLHVSKPPKEGTPQHSLLKELESVRRATHTDLKYGAVFITSGLSALTHAVNAEDTAQDTSSIQRKTHFSCPGPPVTAFLCK